MILAPLARAAAVVALCAGLAAVTTAASSGAAAPDPAAVAVAAARAELGDAYAWGGSGPDAWDCSGLVQAAWRRAGVTGMPRVSRQQQAWAVPVPREQVLPGDLVFFGNPVTHVGLLTSVTPTALTMLDAGSSPRAVVERAVWRDPTLRFGRVPRPGMPAVRPAAVPVVAPLTLPSRTQAVASSPVALRAAALLRAAVGRPDPGDVVLVRDAWRAAGGAVLPSTRSGLVAAGSPVPFADARVGDLVVYAAPAAHVGVYVGEGLMVDGSRSQGRVLLRPVWAAPGLSLVRLSG